MLPYSNVRADSFTDRAQRGNRRAMLPDAGGLSGARMQAIRPRVAPRVAGDIAGDIGGGAVVVGAGRLIRRP